MRPGELLRAAARLDEAPDVLGTVGVGIAAAGDPLGAIARDDVLDALVADADRPHGVDDREADRGMAVGRRPAVRAGQEGLDRCDDRAQRVVVMFG